MITSSCRSRLLKMDWQLFDVRFLVCRIFVTELFKRRTADRRGNWIDNHTPFGSSVNRNELLNFDGVEFSPIKLWKCLKAAPCGCPLNEAYTVFEKLGLLFLFPMRSFLLARAPCKKTGRRSMEKRAGVEEGFDSGKGKTEERGIGRVV